MWKSTAMCAFVAVDERHRLVAHLIVDIIVD